MMSEGSSSTPVFPPGARFGPTDLGLVRLYLRSMVYRQKSNSITTLDVYSDEPWLLDHVHNRLFKPKEWYYFVPRNKRRGSGVNRAVPGRRDGSSEGGTWRSNTVKTEIKDEKKNVVGYKQSLVYNKKVKGKVLKTDWLMTEYSLHEDARDDLVLCWIRDNSKTKVVNQVDNNILSTRAGLAGGANQIQMMMVERDHHHHHGDATHQQQQQQQEKDTPILLLPPRESQNSGFQTMMMTTMQSNDNNNPKMMPNQEQNQFNNFGFDGSEDLMFNIDDLLMNTGSDITLQQPISQAQDLGGLAGQVMFT